jgi:aminoglycoside phosphotransferase (APT) family kinase protein
MGDLCDVIDAARAGALARLSGGMSHDVFAADGLVVVKVFRSFARDEHLREWEALHTLRGTGRAPEPIHCDDDEQAPAVVMSRIEGEAIPATALTPTHVERIAELHRVGAAASLRSDRLALTHPAVSVPRTRALFAEWDDAAPHVADVRPAGVAARAWLATAAPDALIERADAVFSRGDPNITNYLWTDESVRFIDFEDSGAGDRVCDFGEMAEHANMRTVPESLWAHLADASGFAAADRPRLVDARRLLACFWLVILERRAKRGAPVVQITLEEQADRVLTLLG